MKIMKKGLCLVLILSLVISGLFVAGPADSREVAPSLSAVMGRGPIRIDNNTCFNATNGVTGGDGSAGNPWVLENWNINGNGTEFCIYIGNTTDHFIIRNCSVYNVSKFYRNPPQNASILCANITNGKLVNNTVNNSANGIVLYNSTFFELLQNNVSANVDCGIQVVYSNNWSAINNTIYNNNVGLNISDSGFWKNHTIYHNNFINNIFCQAIDMLGAQPWNAGYPMGGNYWSDYTGVDIFNGPYQNWIGSDGIGDTGYPIGAVTGDGYPLMEPYVGQNFGDIVLPYAVSWAPIGISVPVTEIIIIHWNETINWTLVESEFSYTNGITSWNSSNGSWIHNPLTSNSTFTPLQQFKYNTTYWVTLSCNVSDNSNNPLDQNHNGIGGEWPGDVLTWNFTTMKQDLVLPFARNHSPNGTNVPINSLITIEWNETMNWTSVEDAFSYTNGTANWTSADGIWSHDPAANISTFNPNADFRYENKYFVTVNCTATDIIGNLLDQNRNGTGGWWPSDVLRWNFTATDRAPYVVSTIPANGQVKVDPSKAIEILFSERMNRTSVETGFSYTNGTQTWNETDGVFSWNTLQTEFIFSPVFPLERNQTFTVTLNGTLVRDIGGKLLEGGNFSWTFATWLEPPAPHVIDTYPPAGATNVNVNTYINIGFDTEMSIISMDDAFSYTDGIDVWDITNGTVDWFSDNTLFSFQPNEKLKFGSTYTVRVTSNATSIYDKRLDGNDNGIPDTRDDYVFKFNTTLEPPTVLSHCPDANQMGIPISLAAVYINFSKPMNINSVTNGVSIFPNTAFIPSFSGSGKNLTIVLSEELLEATQYRVTVLGTATDFLDIKLDGNNDGVAGDKFTFSFYTAGLIEPVKPQIVSIYPLNNATVPVDVFYVAVTFNVVMNRTSVQQAFKFRNSTADVNGSFSWSASGKSFKFTPSEALAYNTTYYASLQGTAKDSYGQPMVNASNWQYTTEAAAKATSYKDWILYGTIIFLAIMVIILYMANRSLRKDLKRSRVKLKRLKREFGVEEEKPKTPPEEKESLDAGPPDEDEPIEPEKID